MDIDTVRALWPQTAYDAKLGAEWWDGRAEKFSAMELPTAENSIAIRLIEREGMLKENCTALDVGCGGGRFAFVMEKAGARVTATDFSEGMISGAKANALRMNSSVHFSVEDWHTLDLQKKNWERKFDLVLANMTPAVCSADTFLKLSEASRGWVLMVKPVKQKNSVLDKLRNLVGIKGNEKKLSDTLIYSFSLAWLTGGRPCVEYDDETWDNDLPLDKAIREYTMRIASVCTLSNRDKSKIEEYLKSITANGMIHETVHTTVVALYWRTGLKQSDISGDAYVGTL